MPQRPHPFVSLALVGLVAMALVGCPELRTEYKSAGKTFSVTEQHAGEMDRGLKITFTVHDDAPGMRQLSDVTLEPFPARAMMLQKLAATLNHALLAHGDGWTWPKTLRSVPREARAQLLLVQLAIASLEAPTSGGRLSHTSVALWDESPTFSTIEIIRTGPALTIQALSVGSLGGHNAVAATTLTGNYDEAGGIRLEGKRTLSGQAPVPLSLTFAPL